MMDLSAIINHDSIAPPRSYASPPAPAPAPPPISVPASAPASIPAQPLAPPPHKKRKIHDRPVWSQPWTSEWQKQKWAKNIPVAARDSPVSQRPPSSQRANGLVRNGQSPVNGPNPSSAVDRGPKTWEANIVDRVPLDQMTRIVADFLFAKVISAPDLGSDAHFEVEAKLGQLVNQNTNERLQLPVLTDCIVNKNDPSMRVRFESTMTEIQHRVFNERLNDALMKSLPPQSPLPPLPTPRVPLSYRHTRQTDVFYELTPEASATLPPTVLAMFNPKLNKARVRITTDQKSRQEVAKIIKLRLADLDIHSPQAQFDCRISINVEVDFRGSSKELVRVMDRGQPAPERSKDRMTYNHLAYQVDLTQVTSTNQPKEHELEVEIKKIDELRRQGSFAQMGQDNNYEQIVRGFVDNVRLLQRWFPVEHP